MRVVGLVPDSSLFFLIYVAMNSKVGSRILLKDWIPLRRVVLLSLSWLCHTCFRWPQCGHCTQVCSHKQHCQDQWWKCFSCNLLIDCFKCFVKWGCGWQYGWASQVISFYRYVKSGQYYIPLSSNFHHPLWRQLNGTWHLMKSFGHSPIWIWTSPCHFNWKQSTYSK